MTLARYYDVLGVSPAAEQVVVTAAYRALMRKYHPDASGGAGSADRAALINEAYAVLRERHGPEPLQSAGEPMQAADGSARESGERRRAGSSDRRQGPDRRQGSDRRKGQDRRRGPDRRSAPEPVLRRDVEPVVVRVLLALSLVAASSLAIGMQWQSEASRAVAAADVRAPKLASPPQAKPAR